VIFGRIGASPKINHEDAKTRRITRLSFGFVRDLAAWRFKTMVSEYVLRTGGKAEKKKES